MTETILDVFARLSLPDGPHAVDTLRRGGWLDALPTLSRADIIALETMLLNPENAVGSSADCKREDDATGDLSGIEPQGHWEGGHIGDVRVPALSRTCSAFKVPAPLSAPALSRTRSAVAPPGSGGV